jgi:hypothetical protein
MRIVSFDIGIKNLAYCMGDFNEETKELFVEEWDIINLIEDELNAQQKCSHISRNRPYKPCSKFAIFKTANEKEFYCKAHKKNHTNNPNYHCKIVKHTGGEKCYEDGCKKTSKYNVNGGLYCPGHKCKLDKHFKQFKLKKNKTIKCNEYPINKIADKMITVMDGKYQHLLNCDLVLLELQPALAAPKMKSVSNYLSMWFRMRGKHDKVNGSNIHTVSYYRATNKLEFNKDNTNDNKNTYKDRKKTGIKNVNDYFDSINDIENKEKFNTHKKKDDLADALLQILSYLQSNKLLN